MTSVNVGGRDITGTRGHGGKVRRVDEKKLGVELFGKILELVGIS